jgi:hypothetical protein
MPTERGIQRAILSLMYEAADTLILCPFVRNSIIEDVALEFDDADENEIRYALTVLEEDRYIERDGSTVELTLSGVEELRDMGSDVLLDEGLQYDILDVLLEEKRSDPVHPQLEREVLYEQLEPEPDAIDENVWALSEQFYVELQQYSGAAYHSVSITSTGRQALERYNRPSDSADNIAEILGIEDELVEIASESVEEDIRKIEYDIFISHASENKEGFVRPLANELDERGLEVWYDEFELSLGDSLSRSIDQGLSNSDYGLVVLSESFFEKDWTEYELRGLRVKDMGSDKGILPLWHGVDRTDVANYSPTLADKYAIRTNSSSVSEIAEIIHEEIISE